MDAILRDYLSSIITVGLEKNYWFMTKQTMSDFYFIYTISKIVETYPTEKKSNENFGMYYSRFFREDEYLRNTYPKQWESENTYRNAIIAEFFGLFKRERSGYDSGVVTPAYKVLKRYINQKEDVTKFKIIIDRQIEKLCLNVNDKIQNYADLSSVKIFPVMFLYKILYELYKRTGDSTLYYDEFVVFLVRATRYSSWENTVNLILSYRNSGLDEVSRQNYDTIYNDVTASNIRFDALFGILSNIEYTKIQGRNIYKIRDNYESLRYIENAIEIFEASKYANCDSASEMLELLQSDKYFIGNVDITFVNFEPSDNFESTTNEDGENYVKFKNLLAWFSSQLNINNGLLEGTKTSGQGYKEGSTIRRFYNDWRDYGDFTLDCNLISGYQSAFSKVNYINKTDTGINIRPKFDKEAKEIKYFYIDVYDTNKQYGEDISTILEKEYNLEKLSLTDGLEPNDFLKELFDDYCKVIDALSDTVNEIVDYDNCNRLSSGVNIILYGVPGAGKSYTIENEYMEEGTTMERVVFHPDYTYSDFVGQILPKSLNGNVTYEFIPGPFTKIMREAYKNPGRNYILVIEEINRGNAPAIFGDIFQLLDRKTTCESSYGIMNADVAKTVYDNENHEVRIPSNLSIICTMNTSDQNVFTLDTAFQRRWNMRLIENSFKKETKEEREFAEKRILDSEVTWEQFCNAINKQILEKNQNLTSSEDKRLGTHFVIIDDLTFDEDELNQSLSDALRRQARLKNRRFPEKVIKYLWDDAFKFYRDEIFKGEYNSLEKLIYEFTTKSKNDRFNIFKDNIKAAIEEEYKK